MTAMIEMLNVLGYSYLYQLASVRKKLDCYLWLEEPRAKYSVLLHNPRYRLYGSWSRCNFASASSSICTFQYRLF